MGPLAKRLNKQLELLGRDRKAAAEAIQRALVGQTQVAVSSDVPARLTALFQGQPEAIAYFFESPERLEALSKALELDVGVLEALREAQASFRVLVLDRRLDLASRRYIKRRQSKHEDRFSVVEPEGGTKESLRDEASVTPGAIVVLAEAEEEPFFASVGVESSTLHWHRRGYILDRFPELVPLPPAPPPRLVDDDRMPMIPLEALEERLLEGPETAERDQVKQAVERGEIPTFRVDRALAFLNETREGEGSFRWVERPEAGVSDRSLFSIWRAREGDTLAWEHEGRLFYVGPDDVETIGRVREHHPVIRPPSFAQAVERLDSLNPFLCVDEEGVPRFSGPWEEARQAVLEECGVDIADALPSWRERVESRVRPHQVFAQQAPALEGRAREALAALAARPMSVSVQDADLVFAVRRLAKASLVVIPPERADLFHVVADMGRGRLLWARAVAFPEEQPRPIRRLSDGAPWEGFEDAVNLDGGDLHLWVKMMVSEWLAGSAPPLDEGDLDE